MPRLAGALEEGERLVVRVEHHLLGLARIGPHEQHAAVAEPDLRDLHGHRRHPVEHDDLVAPVELVGLARREDERHICRRRSARPRAAPTSRVPPHRIVAARIARSLQLLDTCAGTSAARALARLPLSASIARAPARTPPAAAAAGPCASIACACPSPRRARSPHRVARKPKLPRDRLDLLPLT